MGTAKVLSTALAVTLVCLLFHSLRAANEERYTGLTDTKPAPSADAETRRLFERLGNDAYYEAARQQLIARGAQSLPYLLDRANSENAQTRWYAVELLGAIGDERAVPALIKLMDRDDANASLTALARIGGDDAVTAILKKLPTMAPESVPENVVRALGWIGDSRAIDVLIPLLQVDKSAAQDEYKISQRLALRRATAEALGHFRSPRVRTALRRTVATDPDWSVYRQAKRSLRLLDPFLSGDGSPYDLNRQLDQLVRTAIRPAEPPEGAEAYVRRMWRTGHIAPLPGAFIGAGDRARAQHELLHPNQYAVYTKTDVTETLMEWLQAMKPPAAEMPRTARELIIKIGPPAIPALSNGLRRGDNFAAMNWARCLVAIGDPSALPALREYAATAPVYQQKELQPLIRALEMKSRHA
jgi:HEAT repeat protein